MRIAGLLTLVVLLPMFAYAAPLVNINTASLETLKGLPHVGDVIGQRIIDARPFVAVTDLQNVKGIGNGTYYADIAPLVTIGDSDQPDSPITASSTENIVVTSNSASTYTPPPSTLTIEAGPDVTALLEVPLTLAAQARTKGGAVDSSATVHWSFGDGSSGEGSVIEKTYHYAGTYLVVVTAKDGSATARDDLTVVAKPAVARIAAITGEGIILANDSNERLDLSLWRLTTNIGSYRLPEGTMLLPESSVLFPFSITNLPVAFDAALYYPDGVVAARYVPIVAVAAADVQPSAPTMSYESVQTVEKIISPRTNVQSNDEAGGAPTAATELAAVGAALPPELGTATKSTPSLLHSPWTLSFLGLMALAGGAFILL